jgi:hypothetical protein
MKPDPDYQIIYQMAKPYLQTRHNDVHTQVCLRYTGLLTTAEGGAERITIPAIILHDVGWSKIPQKMQLKAFGPRATMPELNRLHEVEGVKIAREILEKVEYDAEEMDCILEIIDGHDSRKISISLDDSIVKDADKLWRYSREGFEIDRQRFEESRSDRYNRLHQSLSEWFFTPTARRLAGEELKKREKEPER